MILHSLKSTLIPLFLTFFALHVSAANPIRAIYLFKDVMKSNTTALQTSNFNTLIMFGVGVTSNGSIMYYSNTPGSKDVLIASGGSYIGGDALAAKVRSLKSGSPTSVDRLEISMNAQNIRALLANPGPGPNTPLYKNFAALKEAWSLDAVNNDDESLYEVGSTVAFAKLVGQIGYKYTIVPYTNIRFWNNVIKQVNAGLSAPDFLLDRVYLQCYDGGVNNDPAAWSRDLGMKIVPLIWVTNDSKPVYGTTAAQAFDRFTRWNRVPSSLAGGGYWNEYDIEKMGLSYTEYGDVLKRVFV